MTMPSRSDVALMLIFSVGLPLTAGTWWRYFSGYGDSSRPAIAGQLSVAASADDGERNGSLEKERPTLARTAGAATGHIRTGLLASLSGEEKEQ